ncbi:MAG: dihydrolipoyl dehydrogenase [Caldicoprobacterales bacterium]|jgi:dihydrolipoamide dehydrogenase|nr:dihydrolipoyl dehydrogenase [Clostridiales bacterium]
MEYNKFDYDIVIIGGGPGGYVAAIRASQLGLKVAVIEKEKVGGVCLNVGCIPSKALIHQAERYQSLDGIEEWGITIDRRGFDYRKIFNKSREAAETLSKGVNFLLKKNKVDLIESTGTITGKNEVSLANGKKITGRNIIIATGSKPKEIPGFVFDERFVLSSTGILMQEKLPNKILIIGGGAIGVEFAYIMISFGVEVVLVEVMDRILPLEDQEISTLLTRSFKKKGIEVMTGTKALSMEVKDNKVSVALEDKNEVQKTIIVDQILVAVGRVPNSSEIGLEELGVKTENGFIQVGDYYETEIPGIYAIGDVINTPLLAHVASKEGEIAVEYIAGLNPPRKVDLMTVPSAIYCEPQIASFGYTEWRAKQESVKYKKASFPFRGAGKSVAVEQPDGMVKVLYDPITKEILGAHVIGANATELIHEILLAKTAELLPEDIATMIHAHPTLSEAVMESMRAIEGWAIHI